MRTSIKKAWCALLAVTLAFSLAACGNGGASNSTLPESDVSASPSDPTFEPVSPPANLSPVPEAEGMTAVDLGRMAFYVPEMMEVSTTMDEGAYVAAAALGDVSYIFYGYDADLPFSMEYMDEEMRHAYAEKLAKESGFSYTAEDCTELGEYPFVIYNVPLPETGNAAMIFHTVVDGSTYTMLISAEGRSVDEEDAAAAGLIAMTLTAKEAA